MTKNELDGKVNSPVWSSFMVGAFEATVLHPVGTWIKLYHVQNNGTPLFGGVKTPFEKFRMTCRGIHLAGPNKVISRVITLGFQPLIKERIDGHFGEISTQMIAGVGPSLVSTLVTMPLDTYKAKRQTGSSTRNLMELFRDSGKSFVPTVTRNLIGMSSLFGGAALVRQWQAGKTDGRPVSAGQDLAACLSGGVLGAVLSNPPDVIKTQTQVSGKPVLQVMAELGVRGMGRGLGLNLFKGLQRGAVYWFTRRGVMASLEKETEGASMPGIRPK